MISHQCRNPSWEMTVRSSSRCLGRLQIYERHTNTTVCEPLYAAEIIFQSLQASPNAHLDKKIVSTSISSQGWGDGLGWAHNEVSPYPRVHSILPPHQGLAD